MQSNTTSGSSVKRGGKGEILPDYGTTEGSPLSGLGQKPWAKRME